MLRKINMDRRTNEPVESATSKYAPVYIIYHLSLYIFKNLLFY